jgi:polyisoprenoid-binding protein YceI
MKSLSTRSVTMLPLLMLGLPPCALTATPYTMDAAHSTLGFTAIQTDGEFAGHFKDFKADIVFADDDLTHSRFDVVVMVKSVDTGQDNRDDMLRGPDLFAVNKFPTSHFVTVSFTRKALGQYEAAGKLTIRDVTRDIRLPFTFKSNKTASGTESWLKGALMLKRLDYGVGQGEWKDTNTVANEVKVKFTLRLLSAAEGRKTIPPPPPRSTAN